MGTVRVCEVLDSDRLLVWKWCVLTLNRRCTLKYSTTGYRIGYMYHGGYSTWDPNSWPWLSQDIVFFVDGLPPTSLDAGADDLAIQPLFNVLVEPVLSSNAATNTPSSLSALLSTPEPAACLHPSVN